MQPSPSPRANSKTENSNSKILRAQTFYWDQNPIFLLEIGPIPFLGLDLIDHQSSFFLALASRFITNYKTRPESLVFFIVVIFPIEKSTQSTCKGKQYFHTSWPELFIFEDLVFMPRSQINQALDFTLNICRDNFTNFYEHRNRYSGGGRVYIVQLQGMMSRSSH